VSSSRERNDRKGRSARGFPPPGRVRAGGRGPHAERDGAPWLWGLHAVTAALANPRRPAPLRLVATPERARALAAFEAELLPAGEIARLLPPGAAHQGLALKAAPLEPWPLDALACPARGVLLMLDQVTDPQNVGAIFRSAAAMDARGLILQDRHAPALAGALAKAAAGAIEALPHARVTNLSRALEALSDAGWRAIGLAADAETDLSDALDGAPTVLVLGSEGEGLRRLVAEHCELLARIAMSGAFESLNVSAAAAVALYEAQRRRAASD